MLNHQSILREIRHSARQATLFTLCVALSLTTLTAFSGFSRSVGRSLLMDARKLHAADIIIKSYDPVSRPLTQAVDRLVRQKRVESAGIHEFYSVVRAHDESTSVLSRLKVVDKGYPFYGAVHLKSGRSFHDVLTSGHCIVEQTLLDRIGLKVGNTLRVGYTTLAIADVVTAEPDRSLNLFSFGPRIFIASEDLDALGLVATGGRVKRLVLLKIRVEDQLDSIVHGLKQAARPDQESVDTFQTAGSRVKRFIDNFLFFLKLVGLFILMISGLGIQGTLTALLKEKQQTIAIMKTVGATNGYITLYFMAMVCLLGALGILLGITAGLILQHLLSDVISPYLPFDLKFLFSWSGILEGVVLGVAVVALFSFLPLYRLKEMRPVMIIQRRSATISKKWPVYFSAVLFLAFFFALVWWHMQDARFGFKFVGGISALVVSASLLAQMMLWVLKRWTVQNLTLRQAIKGLFRQGNATRATIVTLTVSLTVLFGDYLIEKNLDATYVRSFPPDAPNAFFVDIQPDQTEGFSKAVGREIQFYPIVRARVTAVNEARIDIKQERKKRRDNFSRVFNLTYRQHLLGDETILTGKGLFRDDWTEAQVSILDRVVEMRKMDIGDVIHFKIQGVPLKARVSSIRTRSKQSFSPFFYFVFQEKTLKQAPHTLFAALKIDPRKLGSVQNNIVSRFPNISVIDLSQTIKVFARLMNKLSEIVRVFSMFSIGAGILILVSAVFATRAERMVESVYYKILGAGKSFVFKVFAMENLLMGLLSSVLALTMAQAGAYWICRMRFDISYMPFPGVSALMVAATLLLVMVVGMAASRSIMAKKPVTYLREQSDA